MDKKLSDKIKLKVKDPIAMIVFAELKGSITQKIQKQYDKQTKATPPLCKLD